MPFNPRSQLLPTSPTASISIPNNMFKSAKNSKLCILTLQASVPYRRRSKNGKKGKRKEEVVAQPPVPENGSFGIFVFVLIVCLLCHFLGHYNPLHRERDIHTHTHKYKYTHNYINIGKHTYTACQPDTYTTLTRMRAYT